MNLAPFSLTMKLHAALGLPAMTLKEISVIKSILLSLKDRSELKIFEYGSGYSTCYYARFLKSMGIRFNMHSIDNNSYWHGKVKEMVQKAGVSEHVELHHYHFPPFWEKEGWVWNGQPACGKFSPHSQAEQAYIHAPLDMNEKFDFILIDARFRRRCLELSPRCLNAHGIVCLHDAQKTHYHGPLSSYKHSVFIDSGKYYPFDKGNWKIWLGSMDNTAIYSVA